MTKEDEDRQTLVLLAISGIVLISPILGIQGARSAISAMADPDDDRFRGNNDPEWGITPGAQRKAKQRELQARLDAEKKKKTFPWQR